MPAEDFDRKSYLDACNCSFDIDSSIHNLSVDHILKWKEALEGLRPTQCSIAARDSALFSWCEPFSKAHGIARSCIL